MRIFFFSFFLLNVSRFARTKDAYDMYSPVCTCVYMCLYMRACIYVRNRDKDRVYAYIRVEISLKRGKRVCRYYRYPYLLGAVSLRSRAKLSVEKAPE